MTPEPEEHGSGRRAGARRVPSNSAEIPQGSIRRLKVRWKEQEKSKFPVTPPVEVVDTDPAKMSRHDYYFDESEEEDAPYNDYDENVAGVIVTIASKKSHDQVYNKVQPRVREGKVVVYQVEPGNEVFDLVQRTLDGEVLKVSQHENGFSLGDLKRVESKKKPDFSLSLSFDGLEDDLRDELEAADDPPEEEDEKKSNDESAEEQKRVEKQFTRKGMHQGSFASFKEVLSGSFSDLKRKPNPTPKDQPSGPKINLNSKNMLATQSHLFPGSTVFLVQNEKNEVDNSVRYLKSSMNFLRLSSSEFGSRQLDEFNNHGNDFGSLESFNNTMAHDAFENFREAQQQQMRAAPPDPSEHFRNSSEALSKTKRASAYDEGTVLTDDNKHSESTDKTLLVDDTLERAKMNMIANGNGMSMLINDFDHRQSTNKSKKAQVDDAAETVLPFDINEEFADMSLKEFKTYLDRDLWDNISSYTVVDENDYIVPQDDDKEYMRVLRISLPVELWKEIRKARVLKRLRYDCERCGSEAICFNFECCSGFNTLGFGKLNYSILQFVTFMVTELGASCVFSDASLKALMFAWEECKDPEITSKLGRNPFKAYGEVSNQIDLKFDCNKLKLCKSQHLQVLGSLCDGNVAYSTKATVKRPAKTKKLGDKKDVSIKEEETSWLIDAVLNKSLPSLGQNNSSFDQISVITGSEIAPSPSANKTYPAHVTKEWMNKTLRTNLGVSDDQMTSHEDDATSLRTNLDDDPFGVDKFGSQETLPAPIKKAQSIRYKLFGNTNGKPKHIPSRKTDIFMDVVREEVLQKRHVAVNLGAASIRAFNGTLCYTICRSAVKIIEQSQAFEDKRFSEGKGKLYYELRDNVDEPTEYVTPYELDILTIADMVGSKSETEKLLKMMKKSAKDAEGPTSCKVGGVKGFVGHAVLTYPPSERNKIEFDRKMEQLEKAIDKGRRDSVSVHSGNKRRNSFDSIELPKLEQKLRNTQHEPARGKIYTSAGHWFDHIRMKVSAHRFTKVIEERHGSHSMMYRRVQKAMEGLDGEFLEKTVQRMSSNYVQSLSPGQYRDLPIKS